MSTAIPRSLASHLSRAYVLTFTLILGLVFALLYVSIGSVINARIDLDLAEDVDEMLLAWQREGDDSLIDEIVRETATGDTEEVFLMLVDENAETVYVSNLEHFVGAGVRQERLDAVLRDPDKLEYLTEDYPGRESAVRTVLASLSPTRAIYLAESFDERDEIMELMQISFFLVFVLAIPLAAAIVWWLAHRAGRGIQVVSHTARQICYGRTGARVSAEGQAAEVVELAESFNAMVERNEKLINDMRDMTDNIAHDLRSPLTRVRMIAEDAALKADDQATNQHASESIVIECDRLTQMINTALDVSEAEAGVTRLSIRRVDIGALVADVADLFEPMAEQCGVKLGINAERRLFAEVDRVAIERLVANIVENAIKYTPFGGRIDVKVTSRGNEVIVFVQDSGIGIAPKAIKRVFDRYYRIDDSRTGTGAGLGLAYARAVARLHDGDITVESQPGDWTRFRLFLPLCKQVKAASTTLRHGNASPA